MREARLHDGTVLRFPDETTDDVMTATVRRHLASSGAPATGPESMPQTLDLTQPALPAPEPIPVPTPVSQLRGVTTMRAGPTGTMPSGPPLWTEPAERMWRALEPEQQDVQTSGPTTMTAGPTGAMPSAPPTWASPGPGLRNVARGVVGLPATAITIPGTLIDPERVEAVPHLAAGLLPFGPEAMAAYGAPPGERTEAFARQFGAGGGLSLPYAALAVKGVPRVIAKFRPRPSAAAEAAARMAVEKGTATPTQKVVMEQAARATTPEALRTQAAARQATGAAAAEVALAAEMGRVAAQTAARPSGPVPVPEVPRGTSAEPTPPRVVAPAPPISTPEVSPEIVQGPQGPVTVNWPKGMRPGEQRAPPAPVLAEPGARPVSAPIPEAVRAATAESVGAPVPGKGGERGAADVSGLESVVRKGPSTAVTGYGGGPVRRLQEAFETKVTQPTMRRLAARFPNVRDRITYWLVDDKVHQPAEVRGVLDAYEDRMRARRLMAQDIARVASSIPKEDRALVFQAMAPPEPRTPGAPLDFASPEGQALARHFDKVAPIAQQMMENAAEMQRLARRGFTTLDQSANLSKFEGRFGQYLPYLQPGFAQRAKSLLLRRPAGVPRMGNYGFTKKRTDIPLDVRRQEGALVEDPAAAFLHAEQQAMHAIETAHVIEDMAADPSVAVSTWDAHTSARNTEKGPARDAALAKAKEIEARAQELEAQGWKPVPDDAHYGPMRGGVVHPSALDDLVDLAGPKTELREAWNLAWSAWKSGMIANPKTLLVNVFGGSWNVNLYGIPVADIPSRWLDAASDMASDASLWREAQVNGAVGSSLTNVELVAMRDALAPELANAGKLKPEMVALRLARAYHGAVTGAPGIGHLLRAYQHVEAATKYIIYKDARMRGKTPAEATALAQKWGLNYNRVGRLTRHARKVLPFITFPVKQAQLELYAAATRPWTYWKWWLAYELAMESATADESEHETKNRQRVTFPGQIPVGKEPRGTMLADIRQAMPPVGLGGLAWKGGRAFVEGRPAEAAGRIAQFAGQYGLSPMGMPPAQVVRAASGIDPRTGVPMRQSMPPEAEVIARGGAVARTLVPALAVQALRVPRIVAGKTDRYGKRYTNAGQRLRDLEATFAPIPVYPMDIPDRAAKARKEERAERRARRKYDWSEEYLGW